MKASALTQNSNVKSLVPITKSVEVLPELGTNKLSPLPSKIVEPPPPLLGVYTPDTTTILKLDI